MEIGKIELYRLLEYHIQYPLFSRILNFIQNENLVKTFLLDLDISFKSTNEINLYFETEEILFKESFKCKQWKVFLNKHSFKEDNKMFFHDLIGHITLKNNITSKGEILATAGMCGFSFELGKFYFVNAILIFSLGYNLFDGTRSDNSDITQYIDEINLSYQRGIRLRDYLNFNESLLEKISIEEFLLKNCDKLKDFKV